MEEGRSKTTAAWAKRFGELLAGIHPGYARNRAYSGKFIEYTRPLGGGLLASQNCIAIRGTYHHCFALLLSPIRPPQPLLYTPLYAGSRFHHSQPIQMQYYAEFGRDERSGLHSVHSWRTRAEELVESACRKAEDRLLLHYQAVLALGKENLCRVFRRGVDLRAVSAAEIEAMRSGVAPEVLAQARTVTALDIARWTTDVAVRADAVAMAHHENLQAAAANGNDLLKIAEQL
jgi:hypothetical protein